MLPGMALRSCVHALAMAMALAAVGGEPVSWACTPAPAAGDTVRIELRATCQPGWHFYALHQSSNEGPLPTQVSIPAGPGYRVAGPVHEPEPVVADDPAFGVRVKYHQGSTTLHQDIIREGSQGFTVPCAVEYMACNDKTCLPPRTVAFTLEIPATIH